MRDRVAGGRFKRAVYIAAIAPTLVFAAPGALSASYCTANSGAAAVDLSEPVNQAFLDVMKQVGVRTIIRYYDHEDETLPGKTLRRKERDLIVANGFHIGVVFQHNNNRFGSFTVTRGRQDAERSLALAAENLQPKGSAIYFGVDGGWGKAEEIASIKAYFSAARERFRGSGYRLGVYGSGLVCRELLHDGLAELCWLANAKSWPGYNDYYRNGQWRLVQLLPVDCGGRNVDFNLSSGRDVDYGQFPPARRRTAVGSLATASLCPNGNIQSFWRKIRGLTKR